MFYSCISPRKKYLPAYKNWWRRLDSI